MPRVWGERSRRAGREQTGGRPLSLGLGLAALGRPGYVNLGHADDLERRYDEHVMERRCHDVLDAAWVGGVRHLDVARSYGRAEAFLASWLARRAREPSALTVASKWGYTYTAGWSVTAERHEVKDHSLATLTRQLAETRALLGDHLETRVKISMGSSRGKVVVEFSTLEDLERIYRLMTDGNASSS